MKIRWVILIIAFLAVESCDNKQYPYVPENVRNTFDRSGRNYIEFLEAIVNYRNREDSLKLESLYYLIAHIPSHGYRTYLLQDENGMLIDFNIRDHKNFDRTVEIFDSIKLKQEDLHFVRHYFGKDVYVVESNFLEQLVDSGFHTWKTKPWSSGYSFEVFKKKILPKRLNSGPLDDWMTIVKDTLLPDFEPQDDDPFLVADQVYNRLKGFLTWDERYTQNPTDQRWAEMNKHHSGRSEDAAVLLTAALRSYGIAAAIDFIPLKLESSEYATYWVVVWDALGNKRFYYPFEDSLTPAAWKYYSEEILFNKLKIGQRYALTDKYGNILYEMDEPLR